MIPRKRPIILILFSLLLIFPLICLASEIADQYFQSGISFYDQGDSVKALAEFQKATQEKPDFAQAYYNMAIIYDQQESFPEAIQAYKKVLQIDPNTGMVLENLAMDSYLVGNFKDAMYYVKFAESLGKPINTMLQNQIWAEYMKGARGTLISVSGPESEETKALRRQLETDIAGLEKAIEKKAVTSGDLIELGSKYRQIGDIDKAIEIMKRARELNENNPMLYAELALCYFLDDEPDLFVEYFEKARKLGYKPSVSLRDLEVQSMTRD